jgi:hypothetical protein
MPRWAEVVESVPEDERPSYRQMDKWTRMGLIKSSMAGDRHGRFRVWDDDETAAALLAGRLIKATGMNARVAFELARTPADDDGSHTIGIANMLITVVDDRQPDAH